MINWAKGEVPIPCQVPPRFYYIVAHFKYRDYHEIRLVGTARCAAKQTPERTLHSSAVGRFE